MRPSKIELIRTCKMSFDYLYERIISGHDIGPVELSSIRILQKNLDRLREADDHEVDDAR